MLNLSARGPVSTSQNPATPRPSRRFMGFVSAGRGLMALVVLAFLLAACGGGSGDDEDQMPSVSSGTEIDISAEKDLAPNFTFTMYQGEDKVGGSEVVLMRPVRAEKLKLVCVSQGKS